MDVIDFILNLAALLLWLNWRSLRFDPLVKTSAASLAGTLRRAEPRRTRGWRMLSGLLLLLLFRGLVYWVLGAPVQWTPKLQLGVVVLAFRVDDFWVTLLYSAAGFTRILVICYFWLAVLAVYNRGVLQPDAVLRLIRLHLGHVLRFPWPVILAALPLLVAGLWAVSHPLLAWAGVLSPVQSAIHLIGQSLLLTLALVLTLKYILPVFLLLYFVASYVYLGSNPLWEFVSNTAVRIMAPVRWLPLRFGKLDLAPLVATILVLGLLHWAPKAVENALVKQGATVWPL